MKIGVLALQGAFIEHEKMLEKLNVEYFEIRKKEDILKEMDGIILPGGESTTMGRLLKDLDIFEELKIKIENGMPVFGTCAGMILLANNLSNDNRKHLGLLDITVKRNAYGRQLGSFITTNDFKGINDKVDMVFIRAPYVENVGSNVDILSIVDDNIVAVREKNILATSYHPELTNDTKVHNYFINMIKEKNGIKGKETK